MKLMELPSKVKMVQGLLCGPINTNKLVFITNVGCTLDSCEVT